MRSATINSTTLKICNNKKIIYIYSEKVIFFGNLFQKVKLSYILDYLHVK